MRREREKNRGKTSKRRENRIDGSVPYYKE